MDSYILSLIQSITELLPISSSAHIVIYQHLQGLEISLVQNTALHLGSFLGLLLYFRKEVMSLIIGFFKMLMGQKSPIGRLSVYILVASFPAFGIGLLIKSLSYEHTLSLFKIYGISSIVFGILLFISSRVSPKNDGLNYKNSFLIGVGQCFAFIPGASRLGATLTISNFLGMKREEAVPFCFMLSLPVVCGAVSLNILDLVKSNHGSFTELLNTLLGPTILCAVLTYLFVSVFIKILLKSYSFSLIMIYRILLGFFFLFMN